MLTRPCQTAAYRPGKISEALTEHTKQPSPSAQNRPGVPEASDSQLAKFINRLTPGASDSREVTGQRLDDIRSLDAKLRDTNRKLAAAVQASGTSLTGLFGVGRSSPAP